jgi:hypothetical protein
MKTLNERQRVVACLAVWLLVLLVLWLVWWVFGPENRWWITAIYAAATAVGSFLTFRIWPSTQGRSKVPPE